MTSMYTGVSGLNVSQNALNTTAHNLANVDTKGYVRQQVLIKDWGYENLGQGANYKNLVGLGTATEVVRQVRDRFFDQRYRTEIGRQGFYEAQYKTVQEVEDIFGELEGVSFQNSVAAMWDAMQELAKEPDSIVTRTTFAKNAESFIERAEMISEQLRAYQINLNTQLKDKVERINELGTLIRDTNIEIRRYEASNQERANDLRDARNIYLDELGGIIEISYKEDADGIVNINAEGVPFVNDTLVFKMLLVPEDDTSQMLKPIWKATGADVFNLDKIPSAADNTDVGSLKGVLVARGSDDANYTDIPIKGSAESDIEYAARVKAYNDKVESSVIRTVMAQFDQLIHGIVTGINDIFAPNMEVELAAPVAGYTTGDKIMVLADNAPIGMDADQSRGESIFTRKGMERYQKVKAEVFVLDENGNRVKDEFSNDITEEKELYIYNKEDKFDNYSLYTLGEIEINTKILQNYSVLPLSDGSQPAAYDKTAVNKLSSIWNAAFATLGPNNSTMNTYKNYYTAFIGEISNRGNTLMEITENQEFAVNSLDNDRQNIMGVSSDEELTNLIRFQHAYNASARYVNVIDEMLEHIVTRL